MPGGALIWGSQTPATAKNWLPVKVNAAGELIVDVSSALSMKCIAAEVPTGEVYHVSSGEVWSVLALVVAGELRIDGEVHAWGDVTGGGTITGEGDLRLH